MKALDVAEWFVRRNEMEVNFNDAEPMTHLKLQKLLYYAQGISLACDDEPLFDEEIEAWQHGPVVPEVYSEYKKYGKNPIEVDKSNDLEEISKKQRETMNVTFENFGIYSAWHLRNKTHEEKPWKDTDIGKVITKDLIKQFFREEIIEYDE